MTAKHQDTATSQDGTVRTLADCQGCGVPVWGERVEGHSHECHMCLCCRETYRAERAAFEQSLAAA